MSVLDVIHHCSLGEGREVADVAGQLLEDRIFAVEAGNAGDGLIAGERVLFVPKRL